MSVLHSSAEADDACCLSAQTFWPGYTNGYGAVRMAICGPPDLLVISVD